MRRSTVLSLPLKLVFPELCFCLNFVLIQTSPGNSRHGLKGFPVTKTVAFFYKDRDYIKKRFIRFALDLQIKNRGLIDCKLKRLEGATTLSRMTFSIMTLSAMGVIEQGILDTNAGKQLS